MGARLRRAARHARSAGTVRLIQRMARVCALGQGMKLGTIVGALAIGQALKRVDVPAIPPWRDLLRLNSADPRRIAGPLLIAQASADEDRRSVRD